MTTELEPIVMLRCTATGCPRSKKIPLTDDMPDGTVEIDLTCPWHAKAGGFQEEIYRNEKGEFFDGEEWRQQHNAAN